GSTQGRKRRAGGQTRPPRRQRLPHEECEDRRLAHVPLRHRYATAFPRTQRRQSRAGGPAMISLALAAMCLPLSHFLIASTRLRGLLVHRFGEHRYLASYSMLTLAAFAWLIVAYLRAPTLILWATPPWLAALLLPVSLVGSVLMVAGLSTPNPVI